MSVISMQDNAEMIENRGAVDWLLFNRFLDFKNDMSLQN